MPPDNPETCTLGELDGFWLDIRCPKGRSVTYPLRLLGRRFGPALALGQVLPRLSCKCCRKPPVRVRLQETPYADNRGMAGAKVGWGVLLIGTE